MAKSKKAASKKTAKKPVKKVAKKAVKKVAKKASPRPKREAAKKTGRRFLILYHAPIDAMEQTMNIPPEEQAAGMAEWAAWARRVGRNLADLGAPLKNGMRLTSKGNISPSMREVAGYSLLDAEDWDEVWALLEGHPHVSGWHPEATIEVHETMLLPGM